MNTKAALGLTAGALAVGLLAGLALGHGGSGSSKATGPGPTKTVAGIGVGYARTKEGAVAAAEAYTRAYSESLGKGSNERAAALKAMTLPERESVLAGGDASQSLSQLEKSLTESHASIRLGILGQRISSFSPDAATVRLWTVSVVTRPGAEGQSSWGAGQVELRWINGDWKLWNTGSDASASVVPALVGTPSSADEFSKAVSNFTETGDVGP